MQSMAEDRKPSLDPPDHGSGRRGPGLPAAHRSISASSRSSTSSDILVASGPPPPPTTAAQLPMYGPVLPPSPVQSMAKDSARVAMRTGGVLVITFSSEKGRELLHRLKEDDERRKSSAESDFDRLALFKDEVGENDRNGPNARGTYSKQYTLQHPEIEWVHRGQGRYLPASQSRSATVNRSSSLSKASDYGLRKSTDDRMSMTRSPSVLQRRRSLDDDSKHSIFATPRPRLSLRRQFSESQNIPSARSSRRGIALPTTESERRSARHLTLTNYTEDDEDDSMSDGKEATYTKEYVDAHPGEKFYHTGNGWYKKGPRPKGRRMAKQREGDEPVGFLRDDGTWEFEANATIHHSQLEQYPGVEFHHAGNGWYKPGPDLKGRRSSLVVDYEEQDSEDEDEDEENDEDEDENYDGMEDVAVTKEYTLQHPEVEWVHRGNGRWKRKSAALSVPATQASTSVSPGEERDLTIYTKQYVLDHPEELFHHRGNARYMRGPPPEHWASSRRKRNQATESIGDDAEPQLFNKSYVDAHPEEQFHHRGQGRWARGPRPQQVASYDDEEEDDEIIEDPDGLVDTLYVNTHPDETFHHRGQGRWARGLPPPGSSNKTAVRGPGIRERSDAAHLIEEEDEANRPPALTALVLRAEGPELWPGLEWHYRGGGKWSRVTKSEFEDIQRGSLRKQKGKGRARMTDGPEAQLEREAAAAEAARSTRRAGKDSNFVRSREIDDDAMEGPAIKRRRMNKRGSFQTQESLLSKDSSNTQSQAPTPKPRMLEPEEDILAEEDLPQLYRGDDDWSPAPEDFEEYGRHRPPHLFRPVTSPDAFVKALSKHDPAVRSLDNLKRLAENTQNGLERLQHEYLFLEKVTAPHARIPRKPVRGGRVPIEEQIFEDRKEADLYDYAFDARRIGYQDPMAQKIQRDADGRELRGRRNRSGATMTNNGTLPGWNFGDDEPLGPRRAVKPVNRFDGIMSEPRRRGLAGRNSASKAPSMTPDRVTTPLGGPVPNGYIPATSGRWRGHVPKRIRELQGEIGGPAGGQGREPSPGTARKGRPPGSKNLHRRRDAGIKKGPRRPKVLGDEMDVSVSEDGEY